MLLLVSYYLANNLVTNTAYAVRGLDPPKHKERMARIEHGGQAPVGGYRSGRHGASRFFAEAWHDAWDDAHDKRRELRERRQRRRAAGTVVAEPIEPQAQPDGNVDTPGALEPQDGTPDRDGNVIALASRTRRPAAPVEGDRRTAEPDASGLTVRTAGQPPQSGQESGTAAPAAPPEIPDDADDFPASVVHGGPSPYDVPSGRSRELPAPDIHVSWEEFIANEASLDDDTKRALGELNTRFEAANGALIPITAAEEEALLRARGFSPDAARQAATDAHATARRNGGSRMARFTPRTGQAPEQPATDGGPVQEANTQEGTQMTTMTSHNATGQPTGETAGLGSAIRFADGMANSMRDAAARTETSVASLTGSEVGPGPTAALQHAMEAAQNAAAAFDHAQAELEKQLSVKEAYDATPDAGNKQFLQSD